MKSLKTEEEKGSMLTGIGHGSAGPKNKGSSEALEASSLLSKGNPVNIPRAMWWIMCGNTK
jgi:hypothetical protein